MEPEINTSNNFPPIVPKSNLAMPIAIVLAGLVIAGAIYFGDGRQAEIQTNNNVNKTLPVNIDSVKIDGQPFIGDPNAPITLAYWFDYQCPACQYNENNLITPLVAEYVKTGKVKVIFKDFAFLSADSQTLGITARAVWEAYPDKYYAWHKVIFDNQGEERTGWATKEVITSLTQKVPGIDVTVIDSLIAKNSLKYQKMIDEDKAEGASFGVNATPSFIISDQLIVGVPQYVQLKNFIETLLK